MLKSVNSDTGFNVICISCTEFKSRYSCTTINVLSDAQQDLYLLKYQKLISKDKKSYVCKSCRSNISNNLLPKNSERDTLRYSDFPSFFKNKLKKFTNYVAVISKRSS